MNQSPNHIEIIPGILEQEWSAIEEKITIAQKFTDTLHIDIIDGTFVNNKTFIDPSPFAQYADSIYLELHMMVQDPIKYVEPFARAGFKRFIGHIEMMTDQNEFIAEARKYGETGLALDGPTSLDRITIPMDKTDCFLIYTSEHVGFSGPSLLPDRLEKVTQLRALTDAVIEVDGGINDRTISDAMKSGATRAVATSYIFSGSNPEEKHRALKTLGK